MFQRQLFNLLLLSPLPFTPHPCRVSKVFLLPFIKKTFLIFAPFYYNLLHFFSNIYISKGRVGCAQYMSPEVLTRRQYGKACDVWGAGVMLHVLLSGRLPFNGSGRRLQEAIARGRVPVSWWTRKGFWGFFLELKFSEKVFLLVKKNPRKTCFDNKEV